MLSYRLGYKSDTKNINPKVSETGNKRIKILSKFSACNIKKFKICRRITGKWITE